VDEDNSMLTLSSVTVVDSLHKYYAGHCPLYEVHTQNLGS
jgi:hypothetical protein